MHSEVRNELLYLWFFWINLETLGTDYFSIWYLNFWWWSFSSNTLEEGNKQFLENLKKSSEQRQIWVGDSKTKFCFKTDEGKFFCILWRKFHRRSKCPWTFPSKESTYFTKAQSLATKSANSFSTHVVWTIF